MTLAVGEFIRRFLLHVLPDGFHRVRHYGMLASGHRADNLALCRQLLVAARSSKSSDGPSGEAQPKAPAEPPSCPCCGGRMIVFETFEGAYSRSRRAKRYDSS